MPSSPPRLISTYSVHPTRVSTPRWAHSRNRPGSKRCPVLFRPFYVAVQQHTKSGRSTMQSMDREGRCCKRRMSLIKENRNSVNLKSWQLPWTRRARKIGGKIGNSIYGCSPALLYKKNKRRRRRTRRRRSRWCKVGEGIFYSYITHIWTSRCEYLFEYAIILISLTAVLPYKSARILTSLCHVPIGVHEGGLGWSEYIHV